jgi:hypothetical protein
MLGVTDGDDTHWWATTQIDLDRAKLEAQYQLLAVVELPNADVCLWLDVNVPHFANLTEDLRETIADAFAHNVVVDAYRKGWMT